MRKPSKFKFRDIQRAGKAMMALGYELASLEIDQDGTIKIGVGKPGEPASALLNPFDVEAERLRRQEEAT